MGSTLTLHHLLGSPNSIKARVALGYKGLDYESKPLDLTSYPGDRSAIVDLSRQPRLPVLEDGSTIIFDSGAIARYLEANYPGTATIFAEDHATAGEIERWELLSRTQIGEPVGMFFQQAFSGKPDAEALGRAATLLNERTGVLEDRLSTSEFLVGDHLTIADIACAATIYVADITEELAAAHPLTGFFKQHAHLGDGREKTRAWMRRILAHDPVTERKA